MAAAWPQSACTQSADARRAHARRAESVLIRSENPCPMCGGGGDPISIQHVQTKPSVRREARPVRRGRCITFGYAITRTVCRSRSDRTFRPAAAHARFRQSMGTLSFHVPSPVLAPLWNHRGPGGSRGRGTITMDDAFFKTTMPSSHAFFTCLFHACLLHITHACSRVLRVLDPCSVDRGFHAAGKQSRQSTSTVIASHDQSSFVHRRYRHIPGSVESRFRKLVFRVHDALFVHRRARLRGKARRDIAPHKVDDVGRQQAPFQGDIVNNQVGRRPNFCIFDEKAVELALNGWGHVGQSPAVQQDREWDLIECKEERAPRKLLKQNGENLTSRAATLAP